MYDYDNDDWYEDDVYDDDVGHWYRNRHARRDHRPHTSGHRPPTAGGAPRPRVRPGRPRYRPDPRPIMVQTRPTIAQSPQPEVMQGGEYVSIKKSAIAQIIPIAGQMLASYITRPEPPNAVGNDIIDRDNAAMHRNALAAHQQNQTRLLALSDLAGRLVKLFA